MRHLQLLFIAMFLCVGFAQAQDMSLESLKAMQAEKQAAADALAGEAADLQKKIDEFPGWKIGGVGIVGFDLNSNDNWFAIDNPYSSSNGLGLGASAFANLDREGFFWRNLGTLNLKRIVTQVDTRNGDETEAINDALDISSLYGKKITPKFAISAEGKYLSTLLNFNDPGKLTLSAGATWLPINNLVVIVHPLGYEFNWPSGEYASAAGAKVGATYSANILPNVAWTSNLSAFLPYGGSDVTLPSYDFTDADGNMQTVAEMPLTYGGSDLANWTWINGFSTKILGGLGVGLNVGLRNDRQLANSARFAAGNGAFNIGGSDNPLQVFYNLGLAYTL